MAIKTIEYEVNIAGITPATEQFAGTQGDHRVTNLEFVLSQDLYDDITHITTHKVAYRFDVYDGEGGIWQSEVKKLSAERIGIELEERHTRYGGKVVVYLVITALSADGETEVELYSFPATLRLNNRHEGEYRDGENYESVTGLAEVVRLKADEAAVQAESAQVSASAAADALNDINAAIEDSTDQTYNATSKNAQSGKAVADAIRPLMTHLNNLYEFVAIMDEDIAILYNNKVNKAYVDDLIGDIESLLGGI